MAVVTGARLELRGIELSFAGVRALRGVDLVVAAGSLQAVIGPNGAGKTSLFNCISGLYRPQRGAMRLDDRDLSRLPPHRAAGLGIARMFQNIVLFEQLSVLENMLLGRHHLFESSWWQDVLWTRAARRAEVRHRERVEEVIDFLHLERYRRTPAGILPYGVQKRVELGRALCMEPRLLLLDEPTAGLNQEETEDMARYILDVREELGVTVVLIEHDLGFVMDLADRVAVLDFGEAIAVGTPAEVAADPAVVEAYTGMGAGDG
ncbi:MAG: ABC transporter ATP-binding protein [Planctomycetota bacterium]|nr:ABC transporter ATP-binding protein [Planctomycetota bacterium]MDP6764083.1 ABC transporter ATP-binding protein [Planctomycetota bacterium]MDP6989799.1 ABC transporter ATP-binding protein [Planctomycetota bacterium]